jgi:hypothetical protein
MILLLIFCKFHYDLKCTQISHEEIDFSAGRPFPDFWAEVNKDFALLLRPLALFNLSSVCKEPMACHRIFMLQIHAYYSLCFKRCLIDTSCCCKFDAWLPSLHISGHEFPWPDGKATLIYWDEENDGKHMHLLHVIIGSSSDAVLPG